MDSSVLRRFWPLAAVVGLLALASIASAHSALRFTRVPSLDGDRPVLWQPLAEPPTAPPRVIAEVEQSGVPGWLSVVAGVLCGAAVLVLLGLLIWALTRNLLRRRIGRRPPDGEPRHSPQRTAAEVVAALDAGLVDLSDADADPRRAVIACWVRLEQAAAVAGIARQVGDTPTDLVTRLLAQGATAGASGPAVVSADVLAAFAGVYREARYATRQVDERMRAQARSALRRLRAELTAEVPG